ncbi:Zinc finger MYM-type protein 1 [Glycine max]|nr:Zinc finger MYM-type protein 1 [Glycine max]
MMIKDKWLPLHTLAACGEFYLLDSLLKHNVDINVLKNEDSGPLKESTSSIEHRKWDGLYCLPSEKSEIVSDEYLPTNDPKSNNNINDEAAELVKLTEQSLLLKKRTNQTKPMPIVVRLDDGDVAPISVKRPEPMDDIVLNYKQVGMRTLLKVFSLVGSCWSILPSSSVSSNGYVVLSLLKVLCISQEFDFFYFVQQELGLQFQAIILTSKMSESKDLAFCLPCFLFKNVSKYGGDHFVTEGFSDWKNSQRLANHATSSNSHVDCLHMSYALMNPNQSVKAAFVNQTKQMNSEYRVRVNTSLIATKFLLRCGMPFRGSDESFNSLFKGPFLELVDTLKEINPEIVNIIDCALGNNFMTAPTIQKDLAAACACEITQQIVCDIADDVFCVLIDESGDVAGKEQMVVVIRYVNSEGLVKERFLGIVSVKETNAKSLKEALEKLLSINGLSLSSIRGQGYDGASNMRGKFGGLRTLIQNENPSAYYVHCFAHQLQLALVACAKTHKDVSGFFGKVNMLVNFIRSSNKRQELLRDKQVSQFAKLIEEGQIETDSGLNQESSIARAGDTRWGSHFRTLTSLMTIYGAIIEVLEEVGKDTSFEKYGETMLLLDVLQSFDFIFMLYMMVEILGFTNDLSVALQKRDQDLLNALSLVKATKEELQEMRNDGWEELISKVMEICNKHDIDVPDLDALFDEENTELLQCVSCLSPSSSFEAFDVQKLLRMVELYPNDFVDVPEVVVRHQLQNYVRNV